MVVADDPVLRAAMWSRRDRIRAKVSSRAVVARSRLACELARSWYAAATSSASRPLEVRSPSWFAVRVGVVADDGD